MRIAITGGIAEGKSTVLAHLSEMGFRVASSDLVAREVFSTPEVQAQLAELLDVPPPVAPKVLRQAIMESATLRRAVNRIMHPKIGAARGDWATFYEVPLLIEACLLGEYDRIWVVTCGEAMQRERLVARYGDTQVVDRLLSIQVGSSVRIAFADQVFRTDHAFERLHRDLEEAVTSAGL